VTRDQLFAALVGTGLCGALTTYSTFSFETVRLFEQRAIFYALLNAGASVIAGLGAAYVAIALWP
jgi:fluoride exporter